jgi:hypothetical protein
VIETVQTNIQAAHGLISRIQESPPGLSNHLIESPRKFYPEKRLDDGIQEVSYALTLIKDQSFEALHQAETLKESISRARKNHQCFRTVLSQLTSIHEEFVRMAEWLSPWAVEDQQVSMVSISQFTCYYTMEKERTKHDQHPEVYEQSGEKEIIASHTMNEKGDHITPGIRSPKIRRN